MRVQVACDLDGTTSFGGAPPDARMRAVLTGLAMRDDVALTIATARSPRVIAEWFPALASRLGQVCCNGAIVGDGTRELRRAALDPLLVHNLLVLLRVRGERFCVEYGDRFAASCPDALPWMGDAARMPLHEVSPADEGVVKISVATGGLWAGVLADFVGDGARVYPHGTGDADIVAAGASKASGVELLRSPGDPLIALGNDLNDRELLLGADAGILVGDAMPEFGAVSTVRRVAASSVAVAEALEHAVDCALNREYATT